MLYVNQKLFKDLAWMNVEIKTIYPPYRKWFNSTTNKFETFKLVDEKWNEQTWEDNKPVFKPKEPNYKYHKKVYDIVIWLDKEVELDWKLGNEFTIQALGSTKIRDIAEATVAFGKVPQREDGTPEYDWEEKFLEALPWKVIVFSTKNVKKNIDGKEVEYAEFIFRDVPPTKKDDTTEEEPRF